jgi:hypothetical protein
MQSSRTEATATSSCRGPSSNFEYSKTGRPRATLSSSARTPPARPARGRARASRRPAEPPLAVRSAARVATRVRRRPSDRRGKRRRKTARRSAWHRVVLQRSTHVRLQARHGLRADPTQWCACAGQPSR